MGIEPWLRRFAVSVIYVIERKHKAVLADQCSFCFSTYDDVHVAVEFSVRIKLFLLGCRCDGHLCNASRCLCTSLQGLLSSEMGVRLAC